MKHTALILALGLALQSSLAAENVLTAMDFFTQMQDKYGQTSDYEATIGINTGRQSMQGILAYKAPGLLRIDFSSPANQAIVFNGEELTIYLPEYAAILNQSVSGSQAGGAGMANSQGLQMLRRNYSIAYESSPQTVELEPGSPERVIKLVLTAKVVSEGYRKFVLSVNPDSKLIRRIEGYTTSGAVFRYDFQGIKINQGIPDSRFVYDAPPSANMYTNFLFKTE